MPSHSTSRADKFSYITEKNPSSYAKVRAVLNSEQLFWYKKSKFRLALSLGNSEWLETNFVGDITPSTIHQKNTAVLNISSTVLTK